MRKVIVVGIACFFAVRLSGQVIPVQRTVNWKLAGMREAIVTASKTIDFLKAGGVADGKTANDSVFDHIVSQPGFDTAVIYFPKGKFFFTAPLVLKSNISIRGFSSDSTALIFKLKNEDHLIKIAGNQSIHKTQIDGKLYKDSASIIVRHASGLSVGDYIKISENDSSIITSSWALYTSGQIVRIESIKDSIVYLSSALRRNYLNRNAGFEKLDMVQHVGIENLKIVRMDTSISQTSNVFFQYAANCHVKCIESVDCNFAHIELNNSTNIEVAGSYMHHAFNYGDGGKGYGVVAHLTTGECLIENNIFDSLRHSMLVQAGANGNVYAYNYSKNAIWAEKGFPVNAAGDIVLHGNYVYANLFEGNVVQNIVVDNSHGINGPNNTFFRNRALLYGLIMSNHCGDGQNFVGNEITSTDFLLGNFILNGVENYQYGNNQGGNILPSWAVDLSNPSLYLKAIPGYYKAKTSWPPIGPPNSLDKNMTETQAYSNKGFFTTCSYPALIVDTTKKDTAKAALFFERGEAQTLSIYPNPTKSDIYVIIPAIGGLYVKEATVMSALGQQLLKISGSDRISIKIFPNGLYMLDVQLSDNTCHRVKVVKNGE